MDQIGNGRNRAVNFFYCGLHHDPPRAGLAQPRPGRLPGNPGNSPIGGWMYEAPKLERLGTFRELTLAGGAFNPGDGANPFHRYAPID
jgi:hypothetical protein